MSTYMSAEQRLKCFAYRSSMWGYQEGSKNNIKKQQQMKQSTNRLFWNLNFLQFSGTWIDVELARIQTHFDVKLSIPGFLSAKINIINPDLQKMFPIRYPIISLIQYYIKKDFVNIKLPKKIIIRCTDL